MKLLLVGALLMLALAPQDWRQFRGPDGQGHAADDAGIPVDWSESRNVAWKSAVPGRGWSSPVVAHGRAWLTTAVADGRDTSLRLMSFDIGTGRVSASAEVFRIRNAPLLNAKNSHASPTPIVDDERVYVHFGSEGTAAIGLDATIAWKAKYRCLTQHGNGGSPVLYRDSLVVTCDGADSALIAAIDVRTGKERWKSWRREPWSQAYATPLVIHLGDAGSAGTDQLVSPAAGYAAAYDPANGKEIWRVRYDDGFSNVPRPVFANGLVLITTGFQQPSLLAVRPDGKGDVTRTHVAWRLDRGVPFTPSPIAVGDALYMVSDAGILSVVDLQTGNVRWQERLGGNFSASPILAGGLIFFSSEEGVTTVIRPGARFDRVSVNQLDAPILASMAVSDRSLFVRTAASLYRLTKAANSSGR
jgi:outer membrane protein assembly factor BamB